MAHKARLRIQEWDAKLADAAAKENAGEVENTGEVETITTFEELRQGDGWQIQGPVSRNPRFFYAQRNAIRPCFDLMSREELYIQIGHNLEGVKKDPRAIVGSLVDVLDDTRIWYAGACIACDLTRRDCHMIEYANGEVGWTNLSRRPFLYPCWLRRRWIIMLRFLFDHETQTNFGVHRRVEIIIPKKHVHAHTNNGTHEGAAIAMKVPYDLFKIIVMCLW